MAKQNDDVEARWTIAEQMRRVVEQFHPSYFSSVYSYELLLDKLAALNDLVMIAEIKSAPVNPEELAEIQAALQSVEIDERILREAYRRLASSYQAPIYASYRDLTFTFVKIALMSAVPLLILGIGA